MTGDRDRPTLPDLRNNEGCSMTASRVMAEAEGQQAEDGRVILFEDYLARSLRPPAGPVFWPWAKIRQALQTTPHGERGTLALETPGGSPGTVTPGLSLAVQVIRPGEQTSPHVHSFWHLYIVQDGAGKAGCGKEASPRPIVRGDILLVPAFCPHWFCAGNEGLILVALQNLPHCADIGSLVRSDVDGSLIIMYSKS
jgi:gentisate 1,2-dioxygenase